MLCTVSPSPPSMNMPWTRSGVHGGTDSLLDILDILSLVVTRQCLRIYRLQPDISHPAVCAPHQLEQFGIAVHINPYLSPPSNWQISISIMLCNSSLALLRFAVKLSSTKILFLLVAFKFLQHQFRVSITEPPSKHRGGNTAKTAIKRTTAGGHHRISG